MPDGFYLSYKDSQYRPRQTHQIFSFLESFLYDIENIANQITEQKGDYLLAVKNNQPALFEALEDTFKLQLQKDICMNEELDFRHGRIENRTCFIALIYNILTP